jgi:hypothetical protein
VWLFPVSLTLSLASSLFISVLEESFSGFGALTLVTLLVFTPLLTIFLPAIFTSNRKRWLLSCTPEYAAAQALAAERVAAARKEAEDSEAANAQRRQTGADAKHPAAQMQDFEHDPSKARRDLEQRLADLQRGVTSASSPVADYFSSARLAPEVRHMSQFMGQWVQDGVAAIAHIPDLLADARDSRVAAYNKIRTALHMSSNLLDRQTLDVYRNLLSRAQVLVEGTSHFREMKPAIDALLCLLSNSTSGSAPGFDSLPKEARPDLPGHAASYPSVTVMPIPDAVTGLELGSQVQVCRASAVDVSKSESPLARASSRNDLLVSRALAPPGEEASSVLPAEKKRDQPRLASEPPIVRAAGEGRLDELKELLAAGADVNARGSNDVTPLHAAALLGHKDVVEALLAAGASTNVRDWENATPLQMAAATGHLDIVKVLVASGASIGDGAALEMATILGHHDVVAFLQRLNR